jgi:hypothetical protein
MKKGSNVVCIWQGLGNQMFQYAFAKSLEIKTGRRVFIDIECLEKKAIGDMFGSDKVRNYGLGNFNISLKQVNRLKRCCWNYTQGDKWYYEIIDILLDKGKYPYKYLSQKGYKDISLPVPAFEDIAPNNYIKGWFQSESYFKNIRDVLLREFEPKNKIEFPVKLLNIILNNNSVSIHIRRGDYKKSKMMLDKSYYKKAIELISGKISNPIWIVFSDDIEYVKSNYNFNGDVLFVDGSYGLEDFEQLILMSKCKNNIIANSTFSWWGAWLNQNENKYVVAPDKWFANQKNIVPKSWIKISDI